MRAAAFYCFRRRRLVCSVQHSRSGHSCNRCIVVETPVAVRFTVETIRTRATHPFEMRPMYQLAKHATTFSCCCWCGIKGFGEELPELSGVPHSLAPGENGLGISEGYF